MQQEAEEHEIEEAAQKTGEKVDEDLPLMVGDGLEVGVSD